MKKPTIDEVRAYCQERRNHVDPEAFIDFYQSKGWKVGKSPMVDWKAAVRTWERNGTSQYLVRKFAQQPAQPDDWQETRRRDEAQKAQWKREQAADPPSQEDFRLLGDGLKKLAGKAVL